MNSKILIGIFYPNGDYWFDVKEYFDYLKSIHKISDSKVFQRQYKYNSKSQLNTDHTPFVPGEHIAIYYTSKDHLMRYESSSIPVETTSVGYHDIISYIRNKKLECLGIKI